MFPKQWALPTPPHTVFFLAWTLSPPFSLFSPLFILLVVLLEGLDAVQIAVARRDRLSSPPFINKWPQLAKTLSCYRRTTSRAPFVFQGFLAQCPLVIRTCLSFLKKKNNKNFTPFHFCPTPSLHSLLPPPLSLSKSSVSGAGPLTLSSACQGGTVWMCVRARL